MFVDTNVRAFTPVTDDDHSDTIATSTTVELNTVVAGNLEFDGDVDVFSFKAQGCVTYILTTTLATLNDSVLTLKDTANEVLSSNDDVEAGVLSSLIEHPAAGDGTLFVEVRGYRSYQTGSYTLYVEEEGAEVAFVSKVAPVEVTSQGATQLASALGFEGRIIDLSEAILVIDATERYALSISKKSGAIEFVDQIDYGALQTAGLIERHAAIEIATDFLEAIDLLPPVYEADSFPQIDTLNGSEVETSIGVAFTPLSNYLKLARLH